MTTPDEHPITEEQIRKAYLNLYNWNFDAPELLGQA